MDKKTAESILLHIMNNDYVIPVLNKVNMHEIQSDNKYSRQSISLKEVLTPFFREYEVMLKREKYLTDKIEFLLEPTFTYWWNPRKQEFVDDLKRYYPNINWPTFYPKER